MSKTVHEEKQLGAMINESESMVIYGLKKYLKDFVDHWVEQVPQQAAVSQ